jgi:hypothetical protein
VSVVPQDEAVTRALQRGGAEGDGGGGDGYRHILVQSYMQPQVGF